MITTDFVKGSPNWIDLGAPDVAAAARFYGAVFGWEFDPYVPPEDTGTDAATNAAQYGALKQNGKTVGAIGQLTEEGARSAWTIYFNTPDADATAQEVRKSGGTVRVDPSDAGDMGRMAHFTDPQGAQFAVWQPGKDQGLDAVDDPGTLSWTELYTTDAAASKAFYGSVFGWQTEDMELPGGSGTYSLITPAGLPNERMQGGLMELPSEYLALNGGRPYWHPVFATADCDASVAKVTANGGTVQMGPEDAEGVGRLAVCVDPHGADFVLLTPVEPPAAS
jgi:predicted enzyme related to lactoylglutathione lyase